MLSHPQENDSFPVFVPRWTPRRKAALVEAIGSRKISTDEAQQRFGLSREELYSWIASLKRYGTPGLRATRYQIYRDYP
jgi:transposase-like protein